MLTDPNIIDRLSAAPEFAPEPPRPLYRELPEPSAFPIDALGPVLGKAALAIEAQIQCPIECAANSVLAVASLAAQGRANIILPIGEGKLSPLSLYLFTVLESGERKSSADAIALKPVRDFERELAQQETGERQAHVSKVAARATHEKFLTGRLKSERDALEIALQDIGPIPQPPLVSVIAPSGDQTMEGLFRIYQQGRPSLAMLCDDGATFLGGHSLKSEQKVSTVASLCRAWDGSKLERIRGGDGITVLYDRRLAMHLMVQPGVATDFLSDERFSDQGLLARFLLSAPAGRAGTRLRDDDAYKAATAAAAIDLADYNDAITRLLRHPIRWKDDNDRSIGVTFGSLDLTDDARALYVEFYNELEADMAPDRPFASVKAFASKLPENVARIAGTMELIADAGAASLGQDSLSRAIRLGRFYLLETIRLVATGRIDPELRQAEKLRLWLQSRPGDLIGLREIYRKGPQAIREAKVARAAMDTLAVHGWVVSVPEGATIDGQRQSAVWRIIRC